AHGGVIAESFERGDENGGVLGARDGGDLNHDGSGGLRREGGGNGLRGRGGVVRGRRNLARSSGGRSGDGCRSGGGEGRSRHGRSRSGLGAASVSGFDDRPDWGRSGALRRRGLRGSG